MSKAPPATTSTTPPAPAASSTRARTRPTTPWPGSSARQLSTQDLIARIWDTLEWRNTLQMACIMVIAGITIFLVLAGLELLTHATGLTAAWPVSVSITGTVSYQIGHRQRR
jgi:hypothetical protein